MSQDSGPGPKRSDSKGSSNAQTFLWYMLIAALGIMLVAMYVANLATHEIAYPELMRLIDARRGGSGESTSPNRGSVVVERKGRNGNVARVRYSNLTDVRVADRTITGKVDVEVLGLAPAKPETKAFRTNFLPTDATATSLAEHLQKSNVDWRFDAEPSVWRTHAPFLLITAMLVVFFIVMMRRLSGAGSPMSFGRSRGRLYAQEDLGVMFDDVAGIDEAVEEVREIVDFLRSPEKYQRLGGRIPKGVLLVGPPGTGKTLLAKAIAGEAGVPFFSLSGSDFVEMFVGVGAARVRDMFQQAEAKAPCIIFIDELDALGKSRGSGIIGGHDEREQTLNALLVEMDGFDSNNGVIVMAATNRPETLDAALLRPGRFDRNVLVDRPDIRGREAILKVHVKNVKLDANIELSQVAAITPGFVGADLANLVNEATLLAAPGKVRRGHEGVQRRCGTGHGRSGKEAACDERGRKATDRLPRKRARAGGLLSAQHRPRPQGVHHSPWPCRFGIYHAAAPR